MMERLQLEAVCELVDEQAEELERLRAEVQELRADLARFRPVLDHIESIRSYYSALQAEDWLSDLPGVERIEI